MINPSPRAGEGGGFGREKTKFAKPPQPRGLVGFAEFFKHFRPLYIHAFGNIEEAVQQARSKDMSKASRISHIMNSPSRSDMSNSSVLRQRTTPEATADV